MKSQHRGILAIALSAGFFLLWFTVIKPAQEPTAPASTVTNAPVAAETAAATAPAPAVTTTPAETTAAAAVPTTIDPQANLPIKTVTITNDLYEVELTTDGGVPASWRIKGYHQGTDANSPLIELVQKVPNLPAPTALSFQGATFAFPEKPRYELVESSASGAVFRWRSKELEVEKSYAFDPKNYLVEVGIVLRNRSGGVLRGRPAMTWSGMVLPAQGSGGLLGFMKQPNVESMTPLYYLDGNVEREKDAAKMGPRTEQGGAVLWSGLESRYFLSVIVPRLQGMGLAAEYGAAPAPDGSPAGTHAVFAGAVMPQTVIPAGASSTVTFSAYAGPKEINDLKAIGVHLDDAIDYGWFTVIAVPILYVLKFFYSIVHNYGIAIILLTICAKLLLHPINKKSLKSMKAMQQLQPKLKELQAKYKDDKQRLNQETMQLFRAHKVNPMGGCLPMLLQFPIYIALYKVLWNSIELYHAPFFWIYKDLSAPDPYYITPILLGVFMVAQQKLMPSTSADPAQKKMMMIMPVMFTAFMLFLPVGLVVYILVNTVMSVTQQYMYNHDIGFMDLIKGKWRPKKIVVV